MEAWKHDMEMKRKRESEVLFIRIKQKKTQIWYDP